MVPMTTSSLSCTTNWKCHHIANARKDNGMCRNSPITLMPHLMALSSNGMPDDLFDLAQRLVTRGTQGRSPWLPTGHLGIVYHKGSGAHCSYFQLLCQRSSSFCFHFSGRLFVFHPFLIFHVGLC